jgi:hypothetical protein
MVYILFCFLKKMFLFFREQEGGTLLKNLLKLENYSLEHTDSHITQGNG